MNDAEKTDCPVCGAKSAMWHGEKDRVIAYKGHTRAHRSLGWWCDVCGEGVLGEESNASDYAAFQALIASVDGVKPTGAEQKAIGARSVAPSASCTALVMPLKAIPAHPLAVACGTR
jgi:YgiT-type zinc finger domain-containing protein